jgi:16S rRNA (guanine(1405)-N(7))-methyltransferase
MNLASSEVDALVTQVLNSRKYRSSGLNRATVGDLIHHEAPKHSSQKTLLKAVKRKLHNIVAPYLGELDYSALQQQLTEIAATNADDDEIKVFCRQALAQHASTAERIPFMAEFYQQLFQATGNPDVLLDLACGLHPLAFPWMNLPTTTQFHSYDILQPRIDLINQFFQKLGLATLAKNRDILVAPPLIHADLGIFFKEAHRFDKRQPGCNRAFWAQLQVDILAVSLPVQNLSGTHSLLDQHRHMILENLPGHKRVFELIIENEIIFLIEKPGQ